MRGFILGVLVTLVVLLGGTFLFLKFGFLNVRADAPMSSIEHQIATTAMEASIERAARTGDFEGKANPVKPTEDNLMTGAMLYEKNCSLCHGSVADKGRVSPLAGAFYPKVPQIVRRIPNDADWELFWMTKTGIRWTGMPAWGKTLSDTDIWTIVTFVKHSDKLPPSVQEMWRSFSTNSGIAPAPPAPPAPAGKKK